MSATKTPMQGRQDGRDIESPNTKSRKPDSPAAVRDNDLLKGLELDVKIELGRSRIPADEACRLVQGSVVKLDKLTDDPVDVLVNGSLVARGEVVVLDGKYCVRIDEIVSQEAGPQEK